MKSPYSDFSSNFDTLTSDFVSLHRGPILTILEFHKNGMMKARYIFMLSSICTGSWLRNGKYEGYKHVLKGLGWWWM